MSYPDAFFTVQPAMDGPGADGPGVDDTSAAPDGSGVKQEPGALSFSQASGHLNTTPVSPSTLAQNPPLPQAETIHESTETADMAMKDTTAPEDAPGGPPKAAAAPKKKKGTATVVKGPKKGGKNRKRPKKKGGGAAAAAATSDPGNSGDDESDDESDHGPYCVCRGPDDHRWMISCDGCEDWFHGECVKITKEIGETLIQSYICPNCTDGKKYVTRYKKTCSLDGCIKAARVYSQKDPSIFCSQEHCHLWWEQLISTLPRDGAKGNQFRLTQDDFMGLLVGSEKPDSTWRLGDEPFGVVADFWEKVNPDEVLTPEETHFINESSADRYQLAEEVVLNKKMLELLDMANDRHRAAVAAGAIEKDACGYDHRLDSVGVAAHFAVFIKGPEGEAIFKSGKLTAPSPPPAEQQQPPQPIADGMCRRRKCKKHSGWLGIHTRQARFQIKELAHEAKSRLDAETRVRNGAAGRYLRRRHDRGWVTLFDRHEELEP